MKLKIYSHLKESKVGINKVEKFIYPFPEGGTQFSGVHNFQSMVSAEKK